jgi:hypothetical protein
MPFDIELAVAKLDFAGDPDSPNLDVLRARYPELAFVFDLLEDKLAEPAELQEEYARERDDIELSYAKEVDRLECRVADLRNALIAIADLTSDDDVLATVAANL